MRTALVIEVIYAILKQVSCTATIYCTIEIKDVRKKLLCRFQSYLFYHAAKIQPHLTLTFKFDVAVFYYLYYTQRCILY